MFGWQRTFKKLFSTVLVIGIASNAHAAEISTTDLLNLLVAEGIISEEKAVDLVKKVRMRAEREEQVASEDAEVPAGTVRATYIPQTVKNEIRASVESGLRSKVTEDVVAQAKSERWGVPDALPDWVNKIKLSGDLRLRFENQFMDENNERNAALNVMAANNAGGVTNVRKVYDNVTDDRSRARARARLNVKAKVTEGFDVGLRLVTGNEENPVSANQTIGGYNGKWDFNLDLAFLRYQNLSKSVEIFGGKFKNPFLHTDLVWDSDYNPEGLFIQWNFLREDDLNDDFRQWDPFINVGAFSLKEVHQYILQDEKLRFSDTNDDKWLYAFQMGANYEWFDQSSISFATAVYKYDNVRSQVNPLGREVANITAPQFIQYGNLYSNILSPVNLQDDSQRFGLVSDYTLWNTTLKYDFAGFSPYHIWAELDLVKNVAFKKSEIAKRFRNLLITESNIPDRDEGYQLALSIGWPDLSQRGNWQGGIKYRRLEGDAVLDAFADSDFLLGGTNARGYIISGDYAIKENVLISAKWISADEIDADIKENTAIDTFQLDLNTKF